MRRLLGVVMLLCLSFTVHSYQGGSGDGDQNNNKSAQLSVEINKKTEKALKVFKNLTKDPNASKEAFFTNVGKNPTAAEFEGGDGSDVVTQAKFKIAGDDS